MKRFISYAENYEDLILYHVFHDMKEIFWIDAGASDPWEISVTQFFYDMGGHGINIEPRIDAYNDLCQYRPRDINYCCGVGKENNSKERFCLQATSCSEEVINNIDNGNLKFEEIPIRTLYSIVEDEGITEVHLLKIDVEGYERNVLLGAELQKLKPWVICIETMYQGTYKEWEDIILNAGYLFAMQDHANNRYYLLNEKKEYINRFCQVDDLLNEYDVFLCKRRKEFYKYRNTFSFKIGYLLLAPIRPIYDLLKKK